MWKVTRKFIMLKLLNGISYGNDCLMPEIKITSAESAVNSARNNLSARTNEQKHANDALNALLKEKREYP
ncbi:hypothetical protein KZ779_07480 [Escherichia coli]|nr:hypothetical protein [Escherichia coli]